MKSNRKISTLGYNNNGSAASITKNVEPFQPPQDLGALDIMFQKNKLILSVS